MKAPNYLPIEYKINQYEIIKILGQDRYTITYLVKDIYLAKLCVVKELFIREYCVRHRDSEQVSIREDKKKRFEEIKDNFINRCRYLASIRNRNIVKNYGWIETNGTFYQIDEYIDGVNLKDYTSFDEESAKDFLFQLIHGLKEFYNHHSYPIGIQTSDIIRTSDGVYKIVDFIFDKDIIPNKSPIELAPEFFQTKATIGEHSAIYSLGIIIIKLLIENKNFLPSLWSRIENDRLDNIILELEISFNFKKTLIKITEINPKDRFQNFEELMNFKSTKTSCPPPKTFSSPSPPPPPTDGSANSILSIPSKIIKSLRNILQKRDIVNFSIFAPKSIKPNNSFVLNVWAYLPSQYSQVKETIRETSSEPQDNIATLLDVNIPIGTVLTLEVKLDNFEIKNRVETMVWNGKPENVLFLIDVPQDIPKKTYLGRVIIRHKGLLISTLNFAIKISNKEKKGFTKVSKKNIIPKTAFASYSSRDRDEVLARLQGIRKILPNIDIFLDRLSLHSGDNWEKELKKHVPNKDIFYLFWSESSSKSEWVEREWRLALEKRGLDYIDPIPIDEPEFAPPPKELESLHFNDAYLVYIKYERLKKKFRGDKT